MDDKNLIRFVKNITDQYEQSTEKKLREKIANELLETVKYSENNFEDNFYKGILFCIEKINKKI